MNIILKETTNHYLKSRDFNGLPIRMLTAFNNYKQQIEELVQKELISINFGDTHPNPYILAFKAEPTAIQLRKLKESKDLTHVCLYPTNKHLAKVVKKTDYVNEPFTLLLALGEPQLEYRVFDLSVLESYRNDPRYSYKTDDIQGSIYTSGDDISKKMYKRDRVFLKTFGFAYTKKLAKRAVAVYIRYLSYLSPEHQQFWRSKMLKGKYLLHPDYLNSTMGIWPKKESIFVAFMEEIRQINEMAKLMGKPKFFRSVYTPESKPKEFGFLIRPTLKEYNGFVHLLDKLISENINKGFFRRDIPLETEETKEGKTKIINKGTITLLSEWLGRVHFVDPKPKDEMLKTFRKVRLSRQHPAHSVSEDILNQNYIKMQRKLMIEAYSAIRTFRLILANHPKVKGYTGVPEWLFKAEIWTF